MFLFFLFYFCTKTNATPLDIEIIEEQQFNISLKFEPRKSYVTHYDCSPKSETRMEYYTINKIAPCKITPKNIKHTSVRVFIYANARAREFTADKLSVLTQKQVVTCREIAEHHRADFLNYYNATIPLPRPIDQSELRDHLK